MRWFADSPTSYRTEQGYLVSFCTVCWESWWIGHKFLGRSDSRKTEMERCLKHSREKEYAQSQKS